MSEYDQGAPPQPLLEVVALHPADAENAAEGGADRLHVVTLVGPDFRSPEPSRVSAIVKASDVPVRVTLRLSEGYTTTGGEFTRLLGLASDYLSVGAEGFVLGFLTPALDVDLEVCNAFAEAMSGVPWSFDRAFDQTLDPRRAWRHVATVPGLDDVHTAGAALGMDGGFDDLLAMAAADRDFAAHVMAAGARAEHAPWLMRAGVRRFHVGAAVRPGGSWGKAYVDSRLVRSWRRLLDDAAARLAG